MIAWDSLPGNRPNFGPNWKPLLQFRNMRPLSETTLHALVPILFLCEPVPALQTHGLNQYITAPCHLPAILTERGHKVMVALVMLALPG